MYLKECLEGHGDLGSRLIMENKIEVLYIVEGLGLSVMGTQ